MNGTELQTVLTDLQTQVSADMQRLDIASAEALISTITTAQQSPDFWQDAQAAQASMQQLSKLNQKVQPWQALAGTIADTLELLALQDDALLPEITKTVEILQVEYAACKKLAQYNGPYDDHDAIITLYSGAGGTDAQDWAQMLLRMYTRWAEQNKYTVSLLQESPGEEAGIKSATLQIRGALAYGRLKGEHGVHRLVRLSPFNADNLRQTSFAKVDVLPKIDAPEEVAIDEKDLKVDVFRAGGHGGQSVNTTDSAVRITHLPTGITVAIQNERSQLQNKETALTIVRSRLAQLQLEQHTQDIAKLKGPNEQAAWGNQIRNYVLHPYSMVKDTRTKYETSDVQSVLDGAINDLIEAYAEYAISS